MSFSSAYLLVSHGSRDPRPAIAVEHLALLITQRLQLLRRYSGGQQSVARHYSSMGDYGASLSTPVFPSAAGTAASPLIGTAVLELALTPLHQQIQQFAQQVIAAGYDTIKLLPLFLLPGVHVMEDLPAELAIASQQLGPRITCQICPYLGSCQTQIGQLLLNPVESFVSDPQTSRILIAHGSRRPGSHQPVETIARQLRAIPAYWSVPPSLEDQVIGLIKQGQHQIAILPYFLFEGGITDAIAQMVTRLSQQFPYASLHLSRPLGATPALADCAIDLLV